jgi:hypothetical protein
MEQLFNITVTQQGKFAQIKRVDDNYFIGQKNRQYWDWVLTYIENMVYWMNWMKLKMI